MPPRPASATLTSKGQITIPALVRSALGGEAGDQVEFVQVDPGRFEQLAATQPITALKGPVKNPSKPVTIAAMNAAIAAQGALRLFQLGKADFADCLIKCFADEAA